jgi:hypothetical protein
MTSNPSQSMTAFFPFEILRNKKLDAIFLHITTINIKNY